MKYSSQTQSLDAKTFLVTKNSILFIVVLKIKELEIIIN